MQGQVCSAWPRHQESRNDSEARPWPSVRGSAARESALPSLVDLARLAHVAFLIHKVSLK